MSEQESSNPQDPLALANFLRRYLLRQGCEYARTEDEQQLFDIVLFLESISTSAMRARRKAGEHTYWCAFNNPSQHNNHECDCIAREEMIATEMKVGQKMNLGEIL